METEVEQIRKNHFQTGEMRSQNVSDNEQRRIRILDDIRKLDFHIYSLVIDKRLLQKESGLMYKQPFIKYLNNLAHTELYHAYPRLQMIADEHGSKEFMEGFKEYVHKKHIPDLFGVYKFGFSKSKCNVLIQLSDFICGTIALM